tara:strand:+ start:40 stop:279 length:240 start_codon:yes stop_codon:yes gene_type:complete
MTIIIPTIEKYEVCDYTPKLYGAQYSAMTKDTIKKALDNRKFNVIKTFDTLSDARKFMEGTEYIIRYVFKELEEEDNVS